MSLSDLTAFRASMAATASALEKGAILSASSPFVRRALRECYNPYRVFNVKKVPDPESYSAQDADPEEFFQLLDDLHARRVTGNAARTRISEVLGLYTQSTVDVLRDIIRKDLDCGVNTLMINKAVPGLVPAFDLMLAGKIEVPSDIESRVKEYPVDVEVKLDGERCPVMVRPGQPVQYFTKSGLPVFKLQGVFDAEMEALAQGEAVVFDCEQMADTGFSGVAKAKGKKASTDGLCLAVFDMLTLAEWEAKECRRTHEERSFLLDLRFAALQTDRVYRAQHTVCRSAEEVRAVYQQYSEAGFEGVMVKRRKGLYHWKRNSDWLKLKPKITVDGYIEEVLEGDADGKWVGTLGSFVVGGVEEDGRRWRVNVGSGFPEADRSVMWANRAKLVGKAVELEGQELTLKEGETVWSLRFPTVKKFREDMR
jgi:hypothetical protein